MRSPSKSLPVAVAVALALSPAASSAVTTTWSSLSGDWSQGGLWSAGEPGAGDDAVVGVGSLTVTQADEACASLQLAQGGTPGALQVVTGALSVGGALTIGVAAPASIGTYTQGSGVVSAQALDLVRGVFSINGGSFSVGETVLRLGGTASVVLSGEFVNTGGLTVEFGSGLTATGGVLTCGTDPADEALVAGTFFYGGTPDASFRNLTFSGDTAVFHVQVSSFGLGTIAVDGTLTLDGILQVIDTDAAPGRYDVVAAGAIAGDFDLVDLPPGDWDWGVEGATLYVVKGQQTPAEPASWGAVKRVFAD